MADEHPLSWCHRYDGGRSWCTGMGHTAASFSEQSSLLHILGGIKASAGAAGSDECREAEPGSQAPAVVAAGDPPAGMPPLAAQFSAPGSDPDGDPLTYAWDFGDGAASFLQSPSHTCTSTGTCTARVTLAATDGATGTAEVQITVTRKQPTAAQPSPRGRRPRGAPFAVPN